MSSVTRERRQINGEALLSDAIAAGEEALGQMVVRRLNELLVMAVPQRATLQSQRLSAAFAADASGLDRVSVAAGTLRVWRQRATRLGWIDASLPAYE